MTNSSLPLLAIDIAAALVLTLGIYYPRHRRRDLVVAFLGVNIGVLAVASVLAQANVAAGLGLGLFGVLSIIRLRSSEISQREVAYYFASLAMGLIGGLGGGLDELSVAVPVAFIVLILAVMWFADHPLLLGRSRQQLVRLDRAVADEGELREELEQRLSGTVTSLTVQQLDLVNDSTLVDVRYRLPRGGVGSGAGGVQRAGGNGAVRAGSASAVTAPELLPPAAPDSVTAGSAIAPLHASFSAGAPGPATPPAGAASSPRASSCSPTRLRRWRSTSWWQRPRCSRVSIANTWCRPPKRP